MRRDWGVGMEMTIPGVMAVALASIAVSMLVLWLISIPLKDVSFIDCFWPIGFLVVTTSIYVVFRPSGANALILLILCAVWSLRLGVYLFARWRREGIDGRYQALVNKAQGNVHLFTLRKVFMLQGGMMFVVSLPLQLGQLPGEVWLGPQLLGLGPLVWLGSALALLGIVFESVGDAQLARFKANPANHGTVLDTGLWRYTRHPNYFGDCCVFWGFYLIACDNGVGALSLPGALVITWLLTRWSGAALLERRMQRSKPEYADYVRRTPAFIPGKPGT